MNMNKNLFHNKNKKNIYINILIIMEIFKILLNYI